MPYYKAIFIFVSILFFKIGYANNISKNSFFVPYKNDLKIHLQEKKRIDIHANKESKKSFKVIILLAPLSIPSLESFDVPGYSFMDTLAMNGYDSWGVDFIGQGKSSYPKEMKENPARSGKYPLRAEQAVEQLDIAVKFIQKQTGAESVSLLGWSWGSVVAASYSIKYPYKINKIILYGAMHSFLLPEFTKPFVGKNNEFNNKLPDYQNIPWEAILSHWKMMMQNNDFASKNSMEAVEKVYKKIDKEAYINGTLRRPMGPMKDLYHIWNNHSIYDVSKVKQPVLVIYGNKDIFADKNLYQKLKNSKFKKEVVIQNATHWLIYEKKRKAFDDAVIQFLNKGTASD